MPVQVMLRKQNRFSAEPDHKTKSRIFPWNGGDCSPRSG